MTETVRGEACKTCICFMPTQKQRVGKDGPEVVAGFCRFNPPTPIAVSVPVPASMLGVGPTTQVQIIPQYGPTNETQWCAQYMNADDYIAFKAVRFGDEMGEALESEKQAQHANDEADQNANGKA